MQPFLSDDFLLRTPTAQRLYHDYAKAMPIVDYHCHVSPKEIFEDKRFENITQVWLSGDHYKWRIMRSNGVDEHYITGDADERDKFQKFAEALPKAIGNPMYHWCHLELKNYFGYTGVLNGDTAEEVWNLTKEKLAEPDMGVRGLIQKSNVAMTDLCQYVDVCISNEEDAKDVFGIEAENTDIYGGKLDHEAYKSVAKQLMDKFGFEKVAITLRTSLSANDNDWAGMLYDGENYCFSKSYHLHIVDRVGGGDSFGGGLIYSLLSGKDTQQAIEFAVAASALKHSVEGDYNRVSVAEVEKLAGGDGSGRVQR